MDIETLDKKIKKQLRINNILSITHFAVQFFIMIMSLAYLIMIILCEYEINAPSLLFVAVAPHIHEMSYAVAKKEGIENMELYLKQRDELKNNEQMHEERTDQ